MRAVHVWGIALGGVLLAGCFAARAGQLSDDLDAPWIPGLPIADSFAGIVELDSDPSGAEVTTSLGGRCRTPCSLEVSAEGPFTATFTHEGYAPSTLEVKILHAKMGVSNRQFAPNPVLAHLDPAAPPPPPAPAPKVAPKKPVARAQPPHAAPSKSMTIAQPPSAVPSKPVAATPPPPAVPSKPVAVSQPPQAAQPAAALAPAPPPWPTEVKPIAGINSRPILPADSARSSKDAVGRRWLEDFDKTAPAK